MAAGQGSAWRDAAAWLGPVARAGGQLLGDRLRDLARPGLPRTPEALVPLAERLLREAAPTGAPALAPLRAVRLAGRSFESSNCQNFLLALEYATPADDPVHAPATLYAKLPCRERATRLFANAVGFWSVEVTFCRDVANHVPVRVPRVYAATQQGSRFVLLLEDLSAEPDVVLFDNRDMANGTTPEQAARCIDTFAELHAACWDWPRDAREARFPESLHPYFAPGARRRSRALASVAIEPARRAAPDLLRDDHVALLREAVRKWNAVLEAWYREPLTLVHGDSHLANCFEYAGADGRRVGLLDFQGTHWCPGTRDIQYCLTNSLEPDVLAECETELLDRYRAALARHGVALSDERARAQYRAASLQTLLVAVTTLGLGSLTERTETVRTILRRSLAAIDRLDFADWLADL
ncbi:MAG: hypothetical protein AAF430_07175 [Myxococcota bacterium]